MSKLNLTRRTLLGSLATAGAFGLTGCANTSPQAAASANAPRMRVVVVGGGYGGATAAKYLSMWSGGSIEVFLIERNPQFVSCPMSNLVIGGHRNIDELTFSYDGLRRRGVRVLIDEVKGIDPEKKLVKLTKIQDLRYDHVILSPGIDFMTGNIQGYDDRARETIMHAWKAGPQTVTLRQQLVDMRSGGVVAITIPQGPYRCPPGPYERACQIAFYLKNNKPGSKVMVLDANDGIQSKRGLFTKVFNEQYGDVLEYVPNWRVTELDSATRTITSELGEKLTPDVLNLIPAQRAGDLATQTGLVNVNDRWCDVDWITCESKAIPGIHVLGDATFPAPQMPKSGHMANQHGKIVAAALVEMAAGRQPQPVPVANTCYSYTDDKNVVHVASVHQFNSERGTIVPVEGAGGLSSEPNLLEGAYAWAWAQNIWSDMLT